jgi:hypothetical protein
MRSALRLLLVSLLTLAWGACGSSKSPSTYIALLNGAEEVPAVSTPAAGQAVFVPEPEGTGLSFEIQVSDISDVTAVQLCHGSMGATGPAVADLYPRSGQARQQGEVAGVLASGTLTPSDLSGELAGATLGALLDKMAAGELYVNVLTKAQPKGEVRGQVQLSGVVGQSPPKK